MNIRLVGADGTTINLPSNWGIENIPYQSRNRAEEAVFLDGAQNVGNNRFNSGKIKITGLYKWNLASTTHYRSADDYASYLLAFMRDKGPFKIYEIGLSRDDRYLSECYLDSSGPDTLRRADLQKMSFNIFVMNPFWLEAETPYSDSHVDKDEFTLTNSGDYETYPVFEITATNPNPLFRLINLSDSNRRCEIAYPYFDALSKITIDSYTNRITLNDELDISEFGNGNFIKLLTGPNDIKYTGEPVTIDVSWLKRRTY